MNFHLLIKLNRKYLKFSLLVMASLLLGLLFFQRVFANSSNTIPRYGFLSGVTAYAQVRTFPSHSNANCTIKSYTSPSTTINVIGWTWRQCDLLNNGIIIDSQVFTGSAIAASQNEALAQFPNPPSYNQIKSHGKHDFNHSGASSWQPYNVTVGP